MKYYIKSDFMHLSIILLPAIISMLVIKIGSPKLFETNDLIKFILIIYIPLVLIILGITHSTYVTVNEKVITINYASIIKQNINCEDITSIEETNSGFGLFALRKEKIIIKTKERGYLLSTEKQEQLLNEFLNKTQSSK